MQEYGRAKIKFKLVNDLYGLALHFATVYGDVYARLWALTGAWLTRYAPVRFAGEIPHSVAFFIAYAFVQSVLGVPASIYQNFVVEERFGFNKLTPRTFVADLAKEQALVAVISAPVISALLAIIRRTAGAFYYYVWAFNIALQLFMITIYPIAILPLFNKLSPLEDGALKEGVEALARRLRFPLTNLFVIDGSKRTAHSNAYFFGLPWKKHIVIFDTLIEKSETQEIVAVLGHELGHWSLSHTVKLFALNQVLPPSPHPPLYCPLAPNILPSSTPSTSWRSFPFSSTTVRSTRRSASTTNIPSSSASCSSTRSWRR